MPTFLVCPEDTDLLALAMGEPGPPRSLPMSTAARLSE